MLLEDQRFLHEDLERLEQGISDRVTDEPRQIRERLNRDHQISGFLNRIEQQSKRLLEIYKDTDGARRQEVQAISTGDPMEEFYKQLAEIKDFHRRYPNEPVENLERAYRKTAPGEGGDLAAAEIDNMFTGEESYGRFLDLTTLHEDYLNLPGVKRLTYLQYLDVFDLFAPPTCPIKRSDKTTDQYFNYTGRLVAYLEGFFKRTQPLQDLDKLFASIEADFAKAWDAGDVPGWGAADATLPSTAAPTGEHTGEEGGVWCADCGKSFKNDNVYKNHLTGKKHLRAAAEAQKSGPNNIASSSTTSNTSSNAAVLRLKERAIADREFRIHALTASPSLAAHKADTKTNVERKQGMTERERQMELEALFAESADIGGGHGGGGAGGGEDGSDSGDEERVYNPLKLPLAWDGKPIPYWLYKLHGLGVELPCEICGNFVYMGRRAFDKHFNEGRHIYGLKCLGITNTGLFREITGIQDALKLWDKIQRDKKREKASTENVVQMEDAEGNVMPEKVYYDLQKQGLL